MGVNSLPKTVTRQRRGCNWNPGPSASESSTLTTRLSSYPGQNGATESCSADEQGGIDLVESNGNQPPGL